MTFLQICLEGSSVLVFSYLWQQEMVFRFVIVPVLIYMEKIVDWVQNYGMSRRLKTVVAFKQCPLNQQSQTCKVIQSVFYFES